MKKGKALTLLSIISVLLVALIVATFLRFSVGIKDYNSILGAVGLDYDIGGGTSYTFDLDESDNVDDIDSVVQTVKNRMDKLSFSDYSIQIVKDSDKLVKDYSIKVTVKEVKSSNAADIQNTMQNTVFAHGKVELCIGSEANPTDVSFTGRNAIKDARLGDRITKGAYPLEIVFSDSAMNKIKSVMNSNSGSVYVAMKIDGEALNGLDGSSAYTEENIKDGVLTLYPQNVDLAKQYALKLAEGGIEYKYELASTENVSAFLGQNVSTYSVIAVAELLVLVVIAFFIAFKGFGFVSLYSLVAFIFGEVGLLIAIPGINVSMGGVIGIILASIIAIDGLILTFNRIREEFANGKTVKAAVKTGYRRAFIPILNTHVVAEIITLLLFAFTKGAIRSFAITASIGIVVSFIATALLSRLMTTIFIGLTKKPDAFFNFKKGGKNNENV